MVSKTDSYTFLRLAAFAACVSFFLILLGPLDIYLNNRDEFSSTLGEMITNLSQIAGLSFLLILMMMSVFPLAAKNAFARFLAFVVLSSWVLSNFLYGDYGRLDGNELFINDWSRFSAAQTAVLLCLLLLVLRLKSQHVQTIVFGIFLISLISSGIGAASHKAKTIEDSTAGFRPQLIQFSPSKNVLHVVLDELQSEEFRLAIDSDNKLKAALDGFTFFSDTLSVYPTTEMSIAAMMAGEAYRNKESKYGFIEQIRAQKGGVNQLETLGYEIGTHTFCVNIPVSGCTNLNAPILEQNTAFYEAVKTLDIYAFKSVPDYLKQSIYNREQWLLLDMLGEEDGYLKFESGIAHLLFKEFVDVVTLSDSNTPRYIFFHSLVTHSPTTLNADCSIVNKAEQEAVTKRPALARVEFIKCGLGHFSALLEKLRELGVYDKTLIILSSDHGSSYPDRALNYKPFLERGVDRSMLGRASATMAIKPFGATGPLKTSQAPVSLLDIPQTILAANGLSENNPDNAAGARDVFSVNPMEKREREYLYYKWDHTNWDSDTLPPITSIKINGAIKDPLSWPQMNPIAPTEAERKYLHL
jgi:Sulfatase